MYYSCRTETVSLWSSCYSRSLW